MKKSLTNFGRLTLAAIILLLASQCLIAQTSTNKTVVRQIFPRNGTYEYQILKALNFNPNASLSNIDLNETIKTYSQLNYLEQAFGGLALIAAEVHYMNLPNTTPESALRDIGNFNIPEIRKQVVGYLGALVVNAIAANGKDPLTTALKGWSTGIYKSFKVRAAKGVLDEYNKWKVNPCYYQADGYKAPPDCALKGMNFTQWYSTHKPPEDILGKAGLKSVVGNNADAIASGVAMGLYAITLGAAAVAVTSGLGVIVGSTIISSAGAPILLTLTSLSGAFGGSAGMAGAAGAIGAVSWAGVVAAPVAAAILVIVVGTMEGFRVVEAEKVGPMLKMKLGAAMTSSIDITNELRSKEAINMFYMAFTESSLKGFQYTDPKVDGEARFYCQAGYVSQFKVSYTLKASSPFDRDQAVEKTTKDLSVGQEESIVIPYNAINIKVKGYYAAGTWKEVINTTLSQPTQICYTTYGTIFDAKYKTDCPEVGSMEAKPFELTVTQGGGYTAWVYLSYKQNGKVAIIQDQQGIAVGWRKVYQIPKDATQIYLYIREATGLAWEPWKAVVERTWPNPPNECIKIYGTTLAPKWNNECN